MWHVDNVASSNLKWRGQMSSTTSTTQECGCPAITLRPLGQLDAWNRTFYEPLLIKDNLATLFTQIPGDATATIDVDFSVFPKHQFDQGGIYVSLGEGCFVKSGVEYADGVARLSVVVTNDGWSDWSTQEWSKWDGTEARARVRLHKLRPAQGPCIVVEADLGANTEHSACKDHPRWSFIRIAPIRAPRETDWCVGVFGACPIQEGGHVIVRHATVRDFEGLSHDSDASSMT